MNKKKNKNNCYDVLSNQQTLCYVLEISRGPSQSLCGNVNVWLLSYAASKPLFSKQEYYTHNHPMNSNGC